MPDLDLAAEAMTNAADPMDPLTVRREKRQRLIVVLIRHLRRLPHHCELPEMLKPYGHSVSRWTLRHDYESVGLDVVWRNFDRAKRLGLDHDAAVRRALSVTPGPTTLAEVAALLRGGS